MKRRSFRWNEWNLEHAASHGCTILEIESVVDGAGRGFPRGIGDEKFIVVGRGTDSRLVRVIFLRDEDGAIYVIHAMPLTTRRRRGRK